MDKEKIEKNEFIVEKIKEKLNNFSTISDNYLIRHFCIQFGMPYADIWTTNKEVKDKLVELGFILVGEKEFVLFEKKHLPHIEKDETGILYTLKKND